MIRPSEYLKRRTQLMRSAGDGAVIIVRAAPECVRNNDVLYPYRQRSDFLYLTGFHEPCAMLVLLPEGRAGKAAMCCRERDPKREMWDGPMGGRSAPAGNAA
jgi:Xaa-Pro aminopeptidase